MTQIDLLRQLDQDLTTQEGIKWSAVMLKWRLEKSFLSRWFRKKEIKKLDDLVSNLMLLEDDVKKAIERVSRPRDTLRIDIYHDELDVYSHTDLYERGYYLKERKQMVDGKWASVFCNYR